MRYIVLPNDTIFSIAEKFSVNVADLIKENNLEYIYNLIPGLELIIPRPYDEEMEDSVIDDPKGDVTEDDMVNDNANANNINMDEYSYYIVQKGDNLYQIGKRYNVSPEVLASINGILVDDIIYPDQQILVPRDNKKSYLTKEGDTLESISKDLNIPISEIIANNTIYLKENETITY